MYDIYRVFEPFVITDYKQIYEICTGEKADDLKPELTCTLIFDRMQSRAVLIDTIRMYSVDHEPIYSLRTFLIPDGEPYMHDGNKFRKFKVMVESTRKMTEKQHCPIMRYDTISNEVDTLSTDLYDYVGEDVIPVISAIYYYNASDFSMILNIIYDESALVSVNGKTIAPFLIHRSPVNLNVSFTKFYAINHMENFLRQVCEYTLGIAFGTKEYHKARNQSIFTGMLNFVKQYCECTEFSNYINQDNNIATTFGIPDDDNLEVKNA